MIGADTSVELGSNTTAVFLYTLVRCDTCKDSAKYVFPLHSFYPYQIRMSPQAVRCMFAPGLCLKGYSKLTEVCLQVLSSSIITTD